MRNRQKMLYSATAALFILAASLSCAADSFSKEHGKSSLGQPFWRGKVMENEPVLFIRSEGKPFATGKLLFMPSAKPTILGPDLVMKYEEGKDYVWKPGSNTIELTAGTRIPFKTSAEMVPPPGSPNTLMGVLFAEGYFFHDLQVQVSYEHADNWPLQDAPPAQLLTRSLAKLKAKQPFKLVALGDSITIGGNASGFVGAPPHQPPYPQLVANTLQQRFGASVTLTNLARGGTVAGWGLEMVAKVAAEKPDLVILAFGMNHREPAAGFEAVMRRLRDAVQAACPEADIVLVAPMTGNPCGFPPERFTGYREVLRNLTGPNVALADVTSPWLELLKRKPFSDLSGNNINHPNDFGHRVYAQIIGELFPLTSESIQSAAVKSVRLILPKQPGPVVENTGRVFARQVEQRCEDKVVTDGDAPLTVEFAVEKGIGAEGYRIEDRKGGGVRIAGNDERGLLYGVGKFLRTSRYDKGGFTPGTWRGTSVPQKPVRGIYFATHFNNFYHDAPIEEVERYVEELGLWGFNTVAFWYDMRYAGKGFDDPEAVHLRARLTRIGQAAKRIGLDVGMIFAANDSYQSAPADIRADAGGMRGAIYPWNVCPSKPEGLKYSLKVLGEEFDWAASLKPAYVICWPYDSGGCGCKDCKPWGSNGFIKLSEQLAALAREKLPSTKFVLSTWMFDKGEWQNVVAKFAERKPFFDCVMAEPAEGPIPGGVPWMGFPEISMHETFPWGGFGATPLTGRAQGQWNHVKASSSGGFPYSEGIFEDLTKVVISQFYWNDQSAAETVKEYIAFEFSPDVVADVAGVIKTLEQNHHWRWWPGELEGVKLDLNWFPSRGAKPQADPGAEEAYAAMQRIDGLLTPQAKKAWRWRQLYLRALLDSELKTNGGKPNDKCNEAFAELIKLYYAENANPAVRPPLSADASKNPSSPNSGAAKSPPRDSTTVASSEFSADCHAGKACDGVRASQDEKNFWASANRQDTGAWWRKDLGKRLSIEKIRIQFRGFDGRYHFVPKTITFQVSDDGNTWTTVVSKSADVPANNSPYAATMHTYDINAEGRYVRLLFEDGTDDEVGNSKVVELVEVEVVRADGGEKAGAPVGAVKSRTFNVLNYGAVGDDKTDNTEAFSACLKAVFAAGGGKMFIPDGIYRGRIIIPGTKEWITVEIAGESEPTPVFGTIGTFVFPKNGTIIKCLSESGPAVISSANVPDRMYMQFSGVNVSLRNLDVRTYDNPGIGGIDLLNAVQCKIENVFVNTDTYNVQASKPTHGKAGISTPACNNGALTILRNVMVTGYHTGILVNEHTDADNIVVASNINGLEFVTNHHASRFGRVGTYRNTHHVTVSGKHGFSIEQMNTEQPGPRQTDANNAWQALISDINDPKNLGFGDLNYWVVEGNVGAVEKFTINGGANIRARRIGSAPAGSK